MKPIPTRVHGVLDYLTGLALIAAPWLFAFDDNNTAKWVTIAIGAAVLLYSLLTRYELGVVKALPMPAHLMLDAGGGLLLAVSPWLFGFADEVWVPHVVVGAFEVIVAALTRSVPDAEVETRYDDRIDSGGDGMRMTRPV